MLLYGVNFRRVLRLTNDTYQINNPVTDNVAGAIDIAGGTTRSGPAGR
jgi:hypothetical protein